MGTYIGLIIENKISLGLLSIHLIIRDDPEKLIRTLKENRYGQTILTVKGTKGDVKLVVMIVKLNNQFKILEIIRKINPNAFISIKNVQSVKNGNFSLPQKTRWHLLRRRKS